MDLTKENNTQTEKHPTLIPPRLHQNESVTRITWTFCGALFPATLMSVYYFGMPAVTVIFLCIAFSLFFEAVVQLVFMKPNALFDGNAFLTGLLLALCLPPIVPFYVPAVGSFAAIVIAKYLLGRFGYNIFNQALVGLAVVLICFPVAMNTFIAPAASVMAEGTKIAATPLAVLKQEGMGKLLEIYHTKAALYVDLFLGNRPGALGETSVIALLLGAAFLMMKRYITWHIPISCIATVGVLTWAFGGKEGLMTGDPVFHMLSGGLVLSAFFMATDHATSPSARIDQILFGVACGALTVLIRLKSGYPEGVMFAILIMNCFTPLLDQEARGRIFRKAKTKGTKK